MEDTSTLRRSPRRSTTRPNKNDSSSKSPSRRSISSIPKINTDIVSSPSKNKKSSSSESSLSKSGSNKVFVRAMASFAMSAIGIQIIRMGHFWVIFGGILVQCECFREMVNVRYKEGKVMPLFRTLQWSWFIVAMLHTHGETFCDWSSNSENGVLRRLGECNRLKFLIFLGYCVVLMTTVITFKKNILQFQFEQLMWTLLTICLVVFQFGFFVSNVMHGLFWWAYPALLVITNDVTAYFCGMTFGKKFIKREFYSLSKSKTWEGFIGAGIFTVIIAVFLPNILMWFGDKWFCCPLPYDKLTASPFPEPLTCDLQPIFLPKEYQLPFPLSIIGSFFGYETITILPIQLHGIVYALFASVVAPFGGFLASAIKRNFGFKDFESIIPGHGGIMDRMDCQLVVVAFTFLHYSSFAIPPETIVTPQILFNMAQSMTPKSQKLLGKALLESVKGNFKGF